MFAPETASNGRANDGADGQRRWRGCCGFGVAVVVVVGIVRRERKSTTGPHTLSRHRRRSGRMCRRCDGDTPTGLAARRGRRWGEIDIRTTTPSPSPSHGSVGRTLRDRHRLDMRTGGRISIATLTRHTGSSHRTCTSLRVHD